MLSSVVAASSVVVGVGTVRTASGECHVDTTDYMADDYMAEG